VIDDEKAAQSLPSRWEHPTTVELATLLAAPVVALASVFVVVRAWLPVAGRAGLDAAGAVPVLMANTPATPFHVYYWGQDRFGGWPFVLARWVSGGAHWTPDALFVLESGILVAGLAALGALAGAQGWLVAACAFAAVAAVPGVSRAVLSLSHPYAYQIALFFAAWWAMRHLAGARGWSLAAWMPAAGLLSALAVSSSPLNGAALLWTAVPEAARARGRMIVRGLLCAAAVLLGIGVEIALRTWQHSYIRAQHLPVRWTDFGADRAHAAEGLVAALVRLALPGQICLAAAVLLGVVRVLRAGRRESVPAGDAAWVSSTALQAATILLVGTAMSKWWRANAMDARHLAPSVVLVAVAAAAGFASTMRAATARGAAVVVLLGVAVFHPGPNRSAQMEHLLSAARTLEKTAPGLPLVGPDSVVPVLVALQGSRANIPVVEGGFDRMPWTAAALDAPAAVVAAPAARRLPPLVFTHGRLLDAAPDDGWGEGELFFTRYRNLNAVALAGARLAAGGKDLPGCGGAAPGVTEIRARFGPRASVRVVLAFEGEAPDWDATGEGDGVSTVVLRDGSTLDVRVRGARLHAVRVFADDGRTAAIRAACVLP